MLYLGKASVQRDTRERWQLIPSGTRDWLPREAARIRGAASGVLAEAARWGYREVVTPTLEYLDVLVRAEGAGAPDRLFKLIDRGGELLALRPDMTTSVARLVATRLRDVASAASLPLRVAYAGQVFRGAPPAGAARLREFPQVGCELIGPRTVEADAEIVALTVAAFRAAGVAAFSLSLGHVGFLQSVLAGLDLSEDDGAAVRALLYQKDFVGLGGLLERHRAPADRIEALLALPALRGPDALVEAGRLVHTPEGRDVVRDLERLGEALAAHGVADAVTIDLSIIRDFDYYTGIVFEGHTAAVGAPLGGGGRYDRLLEQFGVALPATGFALRLDRVLAAEGAAEDGAQAWTPDAVVAADAGCGAEAAACARALRSCGFTVALEVLGRPWDEVADDAARRGVPRAILVGRGAARVREGGNAERRVPLSELTATGRRGTGARPPAPDARPGGPW
ncbi:MAG TPA: ATP phosphoribosyltransferase regulatory subunit [bacterium]|nr:ATP phosphoribosyltransferase regulatory subunit [bacterium]